MAITIPNQQPFALRFRKHAFPVIMAFRGEYFCLSNYFEGCSITLPAEGACEPLTFNSTENAYMAWKTLAPELRRQMVTMSADEAKQFAKPDNTAFALRPDYTDEGRLSIMRELVRQKFSTKNPELRRQLLATDDAVLIEGNDWGDEFFGFCLQKARGLNHLGNILMAERANIRAT